MNDSLIFNTCLTLVFILYHKVSRMILFGFVFILYADVTCLLSCLLIHFLPAIINLAPDGV